MLKPGDKLYQAVKLKTKGWVLLPFPMLKVPHSWISPVDVQAKQNLLKEMNRTGDMLQYLGLKFVIFFPRNLIKIGIFDANLYQCKFFFFFSLIDFMKYVNFNAN